MSYNLENIRKLREATGVGIKDCIKSLITNGNDIQKSIEWLKKRSVSSSKSSNMNNSDRLNKFGIVKIKNIENKIISFVLKCESDFVAVNDSFLNLAERISNYLLENFYNYYDLTSFEKQVENHVKDLISEFSYSLKEKIYIEKISFFLKRDDEIFGSYIHYNNRIASFVILEGGDEIFSREIAMQVVANNPKFLSKETISPSLLDDKISEFRRELLEENNGKESEIIKKIIIGKTDKWISENCFLEQKDFRNQIKIEEILNSRNSKIKNFYLINISD
jgi:elongation factor Ts